MLAISKYRSAVCLLPTISSWARGVGAEFRIARRGGEGVGPVALGNMRVFVKPEASLVSALGRSLSGMTPKTVLSAAGSDLFRCGSTVGCVLAQRGRPRRPTLSISLLQAASRQTGKSPTRSPCGL
ncbi:hypothetical protein DFJ73DRAFT_36357 [Zopfochytrium polystomum]|nr:hypothetical protein DFJ73DRAFT_36357 [Zopfochytrium polystomum]